MRVVTRKIEKVVNPFFEEQIRKYGIRKRAKEIGVSASYICDVLKNNRNISKELFDKIASKLPPLFEQEPIIKGEVRHPLR